MVDMYTRCTQVAVKDHIVSEFVKEDGKLRIVIATIAFGMGIDCPNVSCVVHWGPSETVEDYVQEIGRAGRNDHAACALLFFAPCDKVHVATFMVEYSTLHSQCKRVQLFNGFDSFESDHHLEPKCTCCFVCAKACKCGSCDAFLSQFVYYDNTQKAAIATLPLTTHPQWAEPHTFTSLEQIHAPITSLEWLNLPLLPFLPFHNLPS